MAVAVRVRLFSKFRDQVLLDGALDGNNRDFTIPGGEKAIHNPSGGLKVKAYHNTRRLQDTEFVVLESGGSGTGYDLIRVTAFAPPSTSRIFADYVAA